MHTHTHTHTHMSALECLFSSLKIFFLSLCYVLVMYSSSNILSSSFIVSFSSLIIFKTLYFKSLASSLMIRLPQV